LSPAELDHALADRFQRAFTGELRFDESCTPDVHYEDPLSPEPLTGLAALTEHAGRLRMAIPDLRVERSGERLGNDSFACLPWRLLGTHSGQLAALPATGRAVDVQGIHYVELVDARIRRARGFFDLYDVAVQLGLLPGRGTLGESALLLLRGFGLRPRT
jgi:predicted ester cyclase